MASSLINAISGKRVIKARKRQGEGLLALSALPLMMLVLRKGVTRAEKEYNNMDHMDKSF